MTGRVCRRDGSFEDDCEETLVTARLVLFAPLPVDCIAGGDRMELAVGAADLAATLDDDEELARCRGMAADDASRAELDGAGRRLAVHVRQPEMREGATAEVVDPAAAVAPAEDAHYVSSFSRTSSFTTRGSALPFVSRIT